MTKLPRIKQSLKKTETPEQETHVAELEAQSPHFSTTEAPESLRDIVVPDIDDDMADDPDAIVSAQELDDRREADAAESIAEQIMPKQDFYDIFRMPFDMAANSERFAPLAIQPQEEGAARGASDALYSLLRKHFPTALVLGSEQFEMIINMITVFGFVGVKMIILARILKTPPQADHDGAPTIDHGGDIDPEVAAFKAAMGQ